MINSINELSIKQFLQCKLIAELEPDPIVRKMKMLAEVSNMTLDQVESLPIDTLLKKLKGLNELETLPTDAKVNMKFKLGGKWWRIKWRQQDLTGEQYIDATHFCKDSTKIINNIHNILASLAVEVTWYGKELPYDGQNHKQRADLFSSMKIKTAYPILLFFCEYYRTLVDNTVIYLGEEAEKLVKEVREHLEKSGVGLPQSMT